MEKIDINKASREELARLKGVGSSLAERIISYREEVGRFRTVNELAAVAGITDRTIERIGAHLSVQESGTEKVPGRSGFTLAVQLHDGAKADYSGHRLSADFSRREYLSGDKNSLWVTTESVAEVSSAGNAALKLPNRADIKDELRLRVHAPDGELLGERRVPAAKLPEKLDWQVAPKAFAAIVPSDDPFYGKPQRLRGQVIDEAGKNKAAGLQVVIWGAEKTNPRDADFRALNVLQTDANGYFAGPYPRGRFSAAHGNVSVGDEPVSVAIHLNKDGTFPESVILVVDLGQPEELIEECCGKGNEVPRDPDSADLVRADGTFSSDPGSGKCVDFTKPDRTLEEFSFSYVVRTTEPQIKGMTLREPQKIDLQQIIPYLPAMAKAMKSAEGAELKSASMANFTVADNPVASAVDVGILRSMVKDPDGFSLTRVVDAASLSVHQDLLNLLRKHLTLVPSRSRMSCNNPVDWDDEPTVYQSCSIAHGHVLRFKQEWVADGYSMGNLLYSLPLAPGQKKQIAIVDWERRESAARSEALSEEESMAAMLSRDRDISDIVNATVQESVRGGSKSSAGSFAAGLGIGAIIGPVGGLLGIGGGTSSASSSAWQRSSRNTSASALNQLRDRTVQSASAVRSQRSTVVQTMRQGERVTATTETVANYNHCHAITIQYFEVLRHLLVRQRLADVQECLFVPLLMSRFNNDKIMRWRHALESSMRFSRLRRGFGAIERIENNYDGSDFPFGTYAEQLIEHIDGDMQIRFELTRPRDEGDDFYPDAWSWLPFFFPLSADEFYKRHLKNQEQKDRIFLEQLGPGIAEQFVRHLKFEAIDGNGHATDLKVDATLTSDFANSRRLHVSLDLASGLSPLQRQGIKYIRIGSKSSILGIPLFSMLPTGSKVIIETLTLGYRTVYSSGYLCRGNRVRNDLTSGDNVNVYTPLSRQELRNPREEDKELARQLRDHLNEHIERYHHAIWWQMSPDRRYMLLDGFQAPNSNGRSVASVVENELIGIVGNCLVLPVSPGNHLDPTFRQDKEKPVDLLEHYQPTTPLDPSRIALPTKGVYAEAVMGACNSCEYKEEERFWRWEESPVPDSPTAIQPLSTETRRTEPGDLEAKGFPSPIIAMQSAPAAPDPTGLTAAMQLLGTPNLFKDITGLEGTQRNALEALKGAFSTAQSFGDKAANLALQGKMSRDIDKSMRAIKNAKAGGLINDEQARQLTASALQGMIGGGAGTSAKPVTTKEVKELTESAGQNKAKVSVARAGGEQMEVDARQLPDTLTGKVSLSLSAASNSADNRAFKAAAKDKSGIIELEAVVSNAPGGATFRWTADNAGAIDIVSPTSRKSQVRGKIPGKTGITFAVHDSSGVELASLRAELCVPQFISVNENQAQLDAALQALQIDDVKDSVISVAKEVCDHLLRKVNARTVWQFGSFSETLPGHLPAANVTRATFRGDPPTPSMPGITHGPGGSAILNETIDIYPGAYDDQIPAGASNVDVDVETQALVVELENANMTDPDLKKFAIKVFGRLLGETLAHEIVHSLLWTVIPSGHNTPAIANDLMNNGFDRMFRQRTGIEDTAHSSPVDPNNFIDHGMVNIGGLQATNQARIDNVFPVPPTFN